jgi:hypothetical protein
MKTGLSAQVVMKVYGQSTSAAKYELAGMLKTRVKCGKWGFGSSETDIPAL